jgi:hypothetical protein
MQKIDIIADSDDNLQKGVFTLQNMGKKLWNGNITEKSETMALLGQDPVRCKIVADNKCLQVKHFKQLGSEISYENVQDI